MTITMANKGLSRQEKIYKSLLEDIQNGLFKPGDYLPTVRELAKRFATSITPVYLAINRLAKEGFVSTTHGSGIQLVSNSAVEANVRRRPTIDFIGSTPNFESGAAPKRSHLIAASSDWLLWGLSHSKDVRVSVSHFRHQDQGEFRSTLAECLFSDAAVVAFAEPGQIGNEALQLLNRLQKSGRRIVHLGNREDLPQFDRVRSAFRDGCYMLTRYLLENGHRCLLRLNTSFSNWFELQKQEGFQSAIADWNSENADRAMGLTRSLDGIAPDPRGMTEASWDESLIREVLEFHPVTAILAPTDPSVLYLRYAASVLGRDDLEITGYDNSWSELESIPMHGGFIQKFPKAVRYDQPPVSVDTAAPELGAELARLAIKRALGELPDEPQTVTCGQHLVVPEAQ